jgi:hypothetical protein
MFAREKEERVVMARRIAIVEIDRAVSRRLGPTRVVGSAQPAVFNRQVAMYLAKALGGWSVTKIGKFYNGRHHTTVCYAIRRIAALRAVHAEVDGLLKSLAEEIQSSPTPDSQQRIHGLGRPMSGAWPWPISEEFVEDLVERLISRLRPSLEALAARNPQL